MCFLFFYFFIFCFYVPSAAADPILTDQREWQGLAPYLQGTDPARVPAQERLGKDGVVRPRPHVRAQGCVCDACVGFGVTICLKTALSHYEFIDEKGKDCGLNVRNRSHEIVVFLGDTERIKEARRVGTIPSYYSTAVLMQL